MAILGTASQKPRRVRTGCLTCRSRHLKCDEAEPECVNCRRSNRECERGIRLNFIDVQVKDPHIAPMTGLWRVRFRDESRQIASEYVGGLDQYGRCSYPSPTPTPEDNDNYENVALPQDRRQRGRDPGHTHFRSPTAGCCAEISSASQAYTYADNDSTYALIRSFDNSHFLDPVTFAHATQDVEPEYWPEQRYQPLSSAQATNGLLSRAQSVSIFGQVPGNGSSIIASNQEGESSTDGSSCFASCGAEDGYANALMLQSPLSNTPIRLKHEDCEDEAQYSTAYVESVAIWMDALDQNRHFGKRILQHARDSPMMFNGMLACGAKYLALTGACLRDDKALAYYDTANTQLLRSLQNPDRDIAECATTAAILNVYEILSEKALTGMNHMAGARALIRECGWNAQSTGVGSACFWLNISIEVLTCLAFNWKTTWDPDEWGLDTSNLIVKAFDNGRTTKSCLQNFESDAELEDRWARSMVYILAKISNFRSVYSGATDASPHDRVDDAQHRFSIWYELRRLCDAWNRLCPDAMRPLAYTDTGQSRARSVFPQVWLVTRVASLSRILYHTALYLLAETSHASPHEVRTAQQHHARQVCGIIAHTKHHGALNIAISAVALIGPCFHGMAAEQEQILLLLSVSQGAYLWHSDEISEALMRSWNRPCWSRLSDDDQVWGSVTSQKHGVVPSVHWDNYESPTSNHYGHVHKRSTKGASQSMPGIVSCMARPKLHRILTPMSNPLWHADFEQPDHPYMDWYEPPTRA